MKVGVDGVLLGAWAFCGSERTKRVLDAGCGCGLIALMMAQRFPEIFVEAIDIDAPSVEEASENVADSPWADRITVKQSDFTTFANDPSNSGRYGLIISNPPFFDSGVSDPLTPREKARHQGNLSPLVLIETAPSLLDNGGVLAMIAPSDMAVRLKEAANKVGLSIVRTCVVRNSGTTPWKRVMMEFCVNREGEDKSNASTEELTMFTDSGTPTSGYLAIGSPFYLKF